MEFYFDLTDLVAQEAKTARLKSARYPSASVLVDCLQRSSPRIEYKLQQSNVESEAVYGGTNTRLINCNSARTSRSATCTPNISRIERMDESSIVLDKENSVSATLATFKSTLRSPSTKVRNPFGHSARPHVPTIKRMPLAACPDNWMPSHKCDNFCRTLLLNI